ncbi:hypothetical protein DHEL01_v202868 [Diaporthe helianthi]|uniref:Uncharacterized protein n=1 Tax=Diaporthe helianthi TaxID=158607 RepID=A0A2P5I8D0_DIAHE|nr:hypothetical protein DHEL01_v202868 [Diaporthe helianthi]
MAAWVVVTKMGEGERDRGHDLDDSKTVVAGTAMKSKFDGAMFISLLPEPLSRTPERGPSVGLKTTRFPVGSVREHLKSPGEPPLDDIWRAWTRDLAPRDPHYLARSSSLDPDCPCTFPLADLLPRSRPITVTPL